MGPNLYGPQDMISYVKPEEFKEYKEKTDKIIEILIRRCNALEKILLENIKLEKRNKL